MEARRSGPLPRFERGFEDVELGSYGQRTLVGRVQRSSVRLVRGGPRGWRVTVGRAKPAYLEVLEGGRRTVIEIPRPADPWLLLAAGLFGLVLMSVLARKGSR